KKAFASSSVTGSTEGAVSKMDGMMVLTRVPGAAQHAVVRCRPGSQIIEKLGPGSAVHRFASHRVRGTPIVDKSPRARLMRTMRPALALALLLLSGPAFAITGNAPSALVGGRHAVMIVGSHGTSCTGAAIARDLVLTAGHCI